MKKYLSTFFILALLLFLFKAPIASASTLYSNSFNNTSFNDWTLWSSSDVCDDSLGGLNTTNNTRCAIHYNNTFSSLKCISADFDTTSTSADYLFLTGVLGGTGLGNWDIAFSPDNGGRHIVLKDGPHNTTIDSFINTPTGIHNYMVCNDMGTYRGYLDGLEIVNYVQLGMDEDGFSIVTNGSANQANNTITNFMATDSLPSLPTPTPTSVPSPTPTPTPTPIPTSTPTVTPTPTPNDLPVPVLKQTSNPWQSHEYDSSHIWSPNDITIHDWGCALTSAAMILQYNKINKLPDGTPLDPDSLNNWLKKQPDGYVGNGWVNWLSISRLSKQAKQNGQAPLFAADALEYRIKLFADTQLLDFDLGLHIPDILEVPGHFVVAKGINGNTYDINDPYYDRHTLNDGYNNTFLKLDEFFPSFTNLSYIMLVGNSNLNFTLQTATGSAIGESFIQQPITNDNTGTPSGQPESILYAQQPPTGDYMLTVNGPNDSLYSLQGYFYNTQGDVSPFTVSGITQNGFPNTTVVNFDKDNLGSDSTAKITNPQGLINDINWLFSHKDLNQGSFSSLISIAKNIQKFMEKGNIVAAKVQLYVFKLLLLVQNGREVNNTAYQILQADINYLLSK